MTRAVWQRSKSIGSSFEAYDEKGAIEGEDETNSNTDFP